MEQPVVTVVIPVLNGERFIRDAIDSALAQTYPQVEVVVVNDGSTDGTAEILRSYGNRIIVLEQQNEGVAKARNAAINRGRGQYIAFLDCDDIWDPTKIEKQVALFQSDPRLGLVHTGVAWFDVVKGDYCAPLCPWMRPEEAVGDCFDRLILENPLTNSTVMVSRAVLDKVGLINPLSRKNSCQDYDLWLRIARVSHFGYVPEPLITYRLHPNQGIWNRLAVLTDALGVVRQALGLTDDTIPESMHSRFAGLYQDLAFAHLDVHQRREARKYFREAYRLGKNRRMATFWIACFLPDCVLYPLRQFRERLLKRLRGSEATSSPQWTNGD